MSSLKVWRITETIDGGPDGNCMYTTIPPIHEDEKMDTEYTLGELMKLAKTVGTREYYEFNNCDQPFMLLADMVIEEDV